MIALKTKRYLEIYPISIAKKLFKKYLKRICLSSSKTHQRKRKWNGLKAILKH